MGLILFISAHWIIELGLTMQSGPNTVKPAVSGNRRHAEKRDALGTVFLGNSKVFSEKMVFSVAKHLYSDKENFFRTISIEL